jgi:hypothetical protein
LEAPQNGFSKVSNTPSNRAENLQNQIVNPWFSNVYSNFNLNAIANTNQLSVKTKKPKVPNKSTSNISNSELNTSSQPLEHEIELRLQANLLQQVKDALSSIKTAKLENDLEARYNYIEQANFAVINLTGNNTLKAKVISEYGLYQLDSKLFYQACETLEKAAILFETEKDKFKHAKYLLELSRDYEKKQKPYEAAFAAQQALWIKYDHDLTKTLCRKQFINMVKIIDLIRQNSRQFKTSSSSLNSVDAFNLKNKREILNLTVDGIERSNKKLRND